MTTGISLATAEEWANVCAIALDMGFGESDKGDIFPHSSVDNLVLQIHPALQNTDKRITTIIDFEDRSNLWPNNPSAKEVLAKLYKEIPDLLYAEYRLGEPDFRPLSKSTYL
jgi:hypothetical protein